MLWLDIETYSSVNLKKSNVYRYVEAPDFEVLMCAWSTDGKNVKIAVGEENIAKIPGLRTEIKVAHNAPFERICLSTMLGVDLPAEDFIDTQILAAEAGLPQSLESCAKAVGAEAKDSAGALLINLFCKPFKGERRMPADYPEKWERFKEYCIQDVVTLIDVHKRLPDMLEIEKKVLLADQAINDRGIKVDVDLALAAVAAFEDNKMVQELEFINLTGVKNPGSTQQVGAWLTDAGSPLPDLTAATVATALQGDLSDRVRRALELRQALALTASSKYSAALARVCSDNRLRGAFQFFGAHTGRWAGRGVQLQNLASLTFEDEDGEFDENAANLAIWELLNGFGADAVTLKKLVRQMFVGPFGVVDYSQIESRILAWLAGEDWVLQAYRDKRDLYVENATRMGSRYTRKDGKIAELALGYQGAVNSLRAMGATGTDEELKDIVNLFRSIRPRTVRFWKDLEQAFITGGVAGRIRVVRTGTDRHVHLPSGRWIVYKDVKKRHARKLGIDDDRMMLSFFDPRNGGQYTATYGGRLTENVTQATARDYLAEALVRLEDAGVRVVGHVHDEVLHEEPDRLKEVEKIMCEAPDWADGLPIEASGFVTERYRKG